MFQIRRPSAPDPPKAAFLVLMVLKHQELVLLDCAPNQTNCGGEHVICAANYHVVLTAVLNTFSAYCGPKQATHEGGHTNCGAYLADCTDSHANCGGNHAKFVTVHAIYGANSVSCGANHAYCDVCVCVCV